MLRLQLKVALDKNSAFYLHKFGVIKPNLELFALFLCKSCTRKALIDIYIV